MDMAGHLGGGGAHGGSSRAGSLSLEGAPLMGAQEPEESSLIVLARRNTKRNRSVR